MLYPVSTPHHYTTRMHNSDTAHAQNAHFSLHPLAVHAMITYCTCDFPEYVHMYQQYYCTLLVTCSLTFKPFGPGGPFPPRLPFSPFGPRGP